MPENDIGQDRFNRRLTKEMNIKGAMPAPVLAPEIVPVVIVEDERTENLHLQLEHRFGCTLTLGAVAGEYYYFQLWNLAGTDSLVVVEEFGVGCVNNVQAFDFGYANLTLKPSLGLRAHFCLDTRAAKWVPRTAHAGPMVGTDAGGGALQVFGRCSTLQAKSIIVRPNVVLSPGHGFSIWVPTANKDINGWCFWRERHAESGELS